VKRVLVIDTLNCLFTLYHRQEAGKLWAFYEDLRRIATQFKVDRFLFTTEGGSKYREELLPTYKSARKARKEQETPEEKARLKRFLEEDVEEILNFASMLDIQVLRWSGCEADDVIAYIANHIDLEKYQLMILSSDSDLNQLIRPGVVQAAYGKEMTMPMMNGNKIPAKVWLNYDTLCDQLKDDSSPYALKPADLAYVKALSGDTSDSIPSPEGVGTGTALKLMQKYGSLSALKEAIDRGDDIHVPRMTQKAKESLKRDFDIVLRNVKLVDLNHPAGVEAVLFGDKGIAYMEGALEALEYQHKPARKELEEELFMCGKVNIVEKLDTWLAPFTRE